MATVTHHIYSHYDPQQREVLERETGQIPEDKDSEDPWQTESSFGPQRRLTAAPTFVPATISYDEWGFPENGYGDIVQPPPLGDGNPGRELAGWYRSMQRRESVAHSPDQPNAADTSSPSSPPKATKVKIEKRNKNNWFIMKAIQSEEGSSASPTPPPPTLADILERDPPPTATQERFNPPVWLHLGPSNKGFAMLQQSGWNEGEGLGATVVRRVNDVTSFTSGRERGAGLERMSGGREEEGAVKREGSDVPLDRDVQVIPETDIIDLTLSDSDGEGSEDGSNADADVQPALPTTYPPPKERHSQKALLTPIPIILKSDRLGIGLKAKTIGPFRASKKRVTHSAAAMAAHIRAAEEAKKNKREVGRGRRGFERVQKREEENRKRMLAYLNQ